MASTISLKLVCSFCSFQFICKRLLYSTRPKSYVIWFIIIIVQWVVGYEMRKYGILEFTRSMASDTHIFKHLIIFGMVTDKQNITLRRILDKSNPLPVKILDIYPIEKDPSSLPYLGNLDIFCYPDGIKIYDENLRILNDTEPDFSFSTSALEEMNDSTIEPDEINRRDTLHSFVLSDYARRRYCTCLTFHEKMFVENDVREDTDTKPKYSKAFPKCSVRKIAVNPLKLDTSSTLLYVPKCLLLISQQPYLQLQKSFLSHLYRGIILKKVTNSKSSELVVSGDDYEEFRQLYMSYGLKKAEEIFDAEYQQARKKVRRRSDLRPPILVKETGLLEYYVGVTGLFQGGARLRLVEMVGEKEEVMFHYITQHECFHPPDLNVLNIFRKLSLETILKILKNLLLQRQILVFSNRPQSILQLFQSLFYFLKPYLWQNIYVPFLPLHLDKMVQTVGGYVIGMSKIHMDYVVENTNGKVIVLLEEEIVLEQGLEEIDMPQSARRWLEGELQAVGVGAGQGKEQPNEMRQKKWIKTVMKVKQIFFNFMIGLLNNYRAFLLEDPDNMQRVEIDTDKYLKLLPEECRKFNKELTKTMMLFRMCEKTIIAKNALEWNQSDEASLFIYCQSIIEQELAKQAANDSQGKTNTKQANSNPVYWPIFDKPAHPCFQSILAYENYVINKTQRLLDKKQILFNEQYLIKYIRFLESKNLQPMYNRKKPSQQSNSLFSALQKQNQLYFVSLQQKKKNWVYLNKKNSVFFDSTRIVDAKNMFPLMTNSRLMDFDEQIKPKPETKNKCYSHREYVKGLDRSDSSH